ncbi:HAD family hydrolase [Oceanispirochaeta crateris]|uniref:HAD family hydrolase n=2 Tax=Oceanispirochaeta crateris TaxID=2518645 RepID=A0A5C1QLE3_9SPIO|nr:HAD family hydrolase [Oceanispirochaeta crateris]
MPLLKDFFMKYKAVVFDLFTTLTSLRHLKDAPGRFSNQILGISSEEWSDALFNRSRERLTGLITDPVDIIRDIAWKIDPSISEDILNSCAKERRLRFNYCLKHPPAGVVESLLAIREGGYKLGLVSNVDVIEVEGWKGSDLSTCFDTAVFSCYEGYMKPDPEIFGLCSTRLDVAPQDCLYVGDGGNEELIASAKAGMTAVLTSQFLQDTAPEKVMEREKTVNHHIRNLDEILPLLGQLEG